MDDLENLQTGDIVLMDFNICIEFYILWNNHKSIEGDSTTHNPQIGSIVAP